MKRTFKIFAFFMVCIMTVMAFASCDFSLGHTYDEGKYGYDAEGHWICCDSDVCDSAINYAPHELDIDTAYYKEVEGEVVRCIDCVCGYSYTEVCENSYLVSDTESAQAALDAADEGVTIYLQNGVYDTLYIRQSELSSIVENDGNWAGGGHTYMRELWDVSIIAAGTDVRVKSIEAEAQTYTPGGNWHSGDAEYLNSYIYLYNFAVKGIIFDLAENGIAVNVGTGKVEIDGLRIECCTVNGYNNTGRLIYSTADVFDDVEIILCTFNGLEQGINVNDVQRMMIEYCEFYGVASRDILITGPVTESVVVSHCKSEGGTERFIRMADIKAGAYIQISDNTVTDYQGADTDIVKITGAIDVAVELFGNDFDGYNDTDAKENGIVTVILQ